jgi:hypothetical protein
MSQQISAKIIADSVTNHGFRMTTMEIEYPRFILAEVNTHRMLSKNSASSRAIPVQKMHEHIRTSAAVPVHWGQNQAGMQAAQELEGSARQTAMYYWHRAKEEALHWASCMSEKTNLHKQIANRVTEPWMTMKTVISGTEWQNFFWLRAHADAQPEIQALAQKMLTAYNESTPQLLMPGEWHVPYVRTARGVGNSIVYYDANNQAITAKQACIISASCCAQVSYRKNDDSFEKAEKIFRQLIESEPCHASPVEHQAMPMRSTNWEYHPEFWEPGITHMSANGDMWSGNLRGWIQHRKLIPGEAKW